MRALTPLAGAALLVALTAAAPAAADDGAPEAFTIRDPRITESSGLVASRAHPGVYWTHNDSSDGAYLYAVDSRTGRTVARVTLTGVGRPRDVEAISMGPDNTLYVGDIGDNAGGSWDHVWIYKLPEPAQLHDQTVRATQYTVTYADGARNAESLLVHPVTGRVYIVDKNEDGAHLYEGPKTLSTSGTNVFRSVAPVDLWATDAAFSPDGHHMAVRGYFGGILYRWADGRPVRQAMLNVPMQGQGESVAYTTDGKWLMYGSEGRQSRVEPGPLPGGDGAGDDAMGRPAGQKPVPSTKKVAWILVGGLALVIGVPLVKRRRK